MSRKRIKVEEAGRHFGDIHQAMETLDCTPFLNEAVVASYQAHRDRFTGSLDPSGSPWPPRKEEGDGHPLLMDTGRLLQAATGGSGEAIKQISNRDFMIGIAESLPYRRVHDFGYPERNIPQRKYFGPDEDTLEGLDVMFAEFVDEAIFGD